MVTFVQGRDIFKISAMIMPGLSYTYSHYELNYYM